MAEPAYKRWYKTSRWQRLRRAFLDSNPLCVMCETVGKVEAATVCDHINRHRGDEEKFWAGPFQALCKHCHDSAKQRAEKSGRQVVTFGLDGWPVVMDTSGGRQKFGAVRH